MNYSLYGPAMSQVTHQDLLAMQRREGMLLARAEESGSEGCYVEVAIWNDHAGQWQRFCFMKCFGGEHPSDADHNRVTANITADLFARDINETGPEAGRRSYIPIVHRMPDFTGKTGSAA